MALLSWTCLERALSHAPSTFVNWSRVASELPVLLSENFSPSAGLALNAQHWPATGTATIAMALIAAVAALVTLILLWRLTFTPLDRVKAVADVGWGFLHPPRGSWWSPMGWGGGQRRLGGKELAAQIRRLQKMRKKGTLPPVYPNGWFAVAETRELIKGQVTSVQVLGQTLAVFRGDSGEALAVDAYCPHLGANMAAGGMVKGDCIECPFHGWQFSGQDGSCTTIPYTKRALPDVAKVRRWLTHETNGFVFVWHDAEGRDPHWTVPEVQEVAEGRWRYRGRTQHEVLAHVQEIPENGADIAHLGHLHAPSVFKGADLGSVFAKNKVMDVGTHEWQGSWQSLEGASSHIAQVSIKHAFAINAGAIKLFKMAVEARQIGPGLVHLHLDTSLGRGVLVQTVTPLGPLLQRVTHHLYSAPTFVAPFAKFVLHSEACHLERDIMIWNSKQYLERPLLVAEDRLIKKFRHWYQQFYSDSSPTIQSLEKEDLEW